MDDLQKLLENAGITEADTDAFGGKGSYWDQKKDKGEGYVQYKGTQEDLKEHELNKIVSQFVSFVKNHNDYPNEFELANDIHDMVKIIETRARKQLGL